MKKTTYTKQAENLAKAIDIAIDALQNHSFRTFTPDQVKTIMDSYISDKELALNPEPGFANVKSLRFLVDSLLTYFQESSGEDVEYFWQEIERQGLPYKRINRLDTILERGKIRNEMEYDYVTDGLVIFQQRGLIDQSQQQKLSEMIAEFESSTSSDSA